MWQGKDETLLRHAISGDNTGGVDTNRYVALARRGAVEIGE